MNIPTKTVTLDTLVALCKRRGFIYQSAEIYGGLNGVYDVGHLGALFKQNIRRAWLHSITNIDYDVLLLEGSLLGPQAVWQASGHVQNFHDPMVDCLNCKHRYRADDIDLKKACPHCGKIAWTEVRQFNMMFQTQLGAATDNSSIAYLRPETAQSIFINFKNIISTNRVKIPFGVAQIGKAFRNEITPKQFLFRMREFEQMELEWFCKPEESDAFFAFWIEKRREFYHNIGITDSKIRIREHRPDELTHYSKQCADVEYEFPFGWKELEGIAHRGAFDLTQHSTHSGKDLSVHDEANKTSYIPHVVECSVGVDRLFLTLLFDAYTEDIVEGEQRIVLKLHPALAPIKAAFFPLSKQLNDQMFTIYRKIAHDTGLSVIFDDTGSIGKRYRRQDEIGTPVCFTYDFDSATDNCVTVRDRNSTEQKRINIDAIENYLHDLVKL
jgi:glycyl-tRNA synthetase